jgi:hypothetical protein
MAPPRSAPICRDPGTVNLKVSMNDDASGDGHHLLLDDGAGFPCLAAVLAAPFHRGLKMLSTKSFETKAVAYGACSLFQPGGRWQKAAFVVRRGESWSTSRGWETDHEC